MRTSLIGSIVGALALVGAAGMAEAASLPRVDGPAALQLAVKHGGGGGGGGGSAGMSMFKHPGGGGPSFDRGPQMKGNWSHDHDRDHHRHRPFRGPGVYFAPSYDYYDYYNSDCEWLRHRALQTGSAHWWRRYRDCISG